MKGKNQLTTTRKQKNTPVTQIIDFFLDGQMQSQLLKQQPKKMNNYNTGNKGRKFDVA